MDCKNSARNYDMATKLFKIKELLQFQKKSRRKAGEGLEVGQYPFFTSSQIQKKWCDQADYHDESIILGTGGGPSVHCSKDFSTSTDVFILTPSIKNVSAKYIAYFLTENRKVLERGFKGAGLKHISRDYVENIEIVVPVDHAGKPDIKEQSRIVRLLEEAEILIQKRAEADQKTIELFDALFANAFGNLDTTLLPKKLLKEVTTFITDGTHLPPAFTSEGIPFLFVRNITKGFIDFNTEKFVSEESYIKLTKKYRPEKYDILYSTVGSYGIAVMVNTDNKFTFQRHIGHIRPDNKIILPEFLNAQLNTSFVRKQADLKVRGVAQKTLNLDELRKLCVVVPSLEEQRSFVERLKDLQLVQNKQSHSSVAIEELFSSLLSRSFA